MCVCPLSAPYLNPIMVCVACNPPGVWYRFKCIICSPGLIFDSSVGFCVCPAGSYFNANDVCIKCTAPSYWNMITLSCESCPQSTYWDEATFRCISCPAGFTFDTSKLKCVAALPSCPNNAPYWNGNACIPCPLNTSYDSSSQNCITSCLPGQNYDPIDKKCINP